MSSTPAAIRHVMARLRELERGWRHPKAPATMAAMQNASDTHSLNRHVPQAISAVTSDMTAHIRAPDFFFGASGSGVSGAPAVSVAGAETAADGASLMTAGVCAAAEVSDLVCDDGVVMIIEESSVFAKVIIFFVFLCTFADNSQFSDF